MMAAEDEGCAAAAIFADGLYVRWDIFVGRKHLTLNDIVDIFSKDSDVEAKFEEYHGLSCGKLDCSLW